MLHLGPKALGFCRESEKESYIALATRTGPIQVSHSSQVTSDFDTGTEQQPQTHIERPGGLPSHTAEQGMAGPDFCQRDQVKRKSYRALRLFLVKPGPPRHCLHIGAENLKIPNFETLVTCFNLELGSGGTGHDVLFFFFFLGGGGLFPELSGRAYQLGPS